VLERPDGVAEILQEINGRPAPFVTTAVPQADPIMATLPEAWRPMARRTWRLDRVTDSAAFYREEA
jgi:hypothetical protein